MSYVNGIPIINLDTDSDSDDSIKEKLSTAKKNDNFPSETTRSNSDVDSQSEDETIEDNRLMPFENATEVKQHLKRVYSENAQYYSSFQINENNGKCRISECDRPIHNFYCCLEHCEELKSVFQEINNRYCAKCNLRKCTFGRRTCYSCVDSRLSNYRIIFPKAESLENKIKEIVLIAIEKLKSYPGGKIYIGKSDEEGAKIRHQRHITRFVLSDENVDFSVFHIGDEKEAFYAEHEILAKISDTVPISKMLNECPGGFGGCSSNSLQENFVVYVFIAKKFDYQFGPGHSSIDFHTWSIRSNDYTSIQKISFPELSRFQLPKFDCHLTVNDVARLLGYETMKQHRVDAGIKKVVCWVCGMRFLTVGNFNQHFQVSHNGKKRIRNGGELYLSIHKL